MKREKQSNKTAILEKLKESIMSEEVDSKEVEDLPRSVENPDVAAELIGRIECIMNSKKNNILILAYHQGIIFRKVKENKKFMSTVTKFKIHKATINFEIGIIKFIDDYPKMRKSTLLLHFLKNNFCKEYATEFQ